MGRGRKQKWEAVESYRERKKEMEELGWGEQGGRAGAEGGEMLFGWKSLQLLSYTEAMRDVQQLFSVPAVFLLARLTSPWERKAVGYMVIENSMGHYKSKTEFGREGRLLEDKEKVRRVEEVWRIEKEK